MFWTYRSKQYMLNKSEDSTGVIKSRNLKDRQHSDENIED